jgi:cation transport regulator ChaC
MANSDIWLFGYGSLIWRPDFPFRQQSPGIIDGWSRRFWQGSHDHRGVPEAPGRVVTLVPSAAARCGGMAFQIDAAVAAEIFAQLDYREKNGYERLQLDCALATGEVVPCVTYIAARSNEAWLGEASLAEIAAQINASHGPSGANRDYLLKLAQALRELDIEDDHVTALEALVLAMDE